MTLENWENRLHNHNWMMNERARMVTALRMLITGSVMLILQDEKEITLSDLEQELLADIPDAPEGVNLEEILTSVIRELESAGVLKLTLTKAIYIPMDPKKSTPRSI